jgi:hypothetical protein
MLFLQPFFTATAPSQVPRCTDDAALEPTDYRRAQPTESQDRVWDFVIGAGIITVRQRAAAQHRKACTTLVSPLFQGPLIMESNLSTHRALAELELALKMMPRNFFSPLSLYYVKVKRPKLHADTASLIILDA